MADPDALAPYPAPVDPRMQPPQSDPLAADYRQNVQDIRGSIEKEGRIAAERNAALAGPRQQMTEMTRQPLPQPPVPRDAPPVPGRTSAADDEAWLAVAGVLGAIAGGLTRNHATNAIAAMTGAMQGYTEGSQIKFDQEMKRWDAENKKMLETNQAANDRYTQILQSNKLALEQKSMELQMVAAQYDDRATMQLAQTKQFEVLGRLIEQRLQHQAQQQDKAAVIEEKAREWYQRRQEHQDKMQLEREKFELQKGQGEEQADEARALAISKYQLPPIANPRQPRDRRVMSRVLELDPEYDARQYVASNRATTQFAIGQQGNAIRSLNVAISHLGTLDELGEALQTGNTQWFNQARNFFHQQFGQEAPTNFNAAKQIVGAEIIKGVVASGGGVSEREEAARVISTANSPQQLRGVISTYKQLLAGQLEGLKKQYEDTTKRTDFDKRLTPQAQKELGVGGAPSAPAAGAPHAPSTRELIAPDGSKWSVEVQ
jgi:hypothetical protein